MKKALAAALALLLTLLCCAQAASGARYRVEVNLASQIVTVYEKNTDVIVRQMICSSGQPDSADATPCGSFTVKQHYPNERSEWYYIKNYAVYVQYVTRFNGPYLFHSIPYAKKDVATVDYAARSALGTPVSHGCIRMRSEDARWIALNCADGTNVRVFNGEADSDTRALAEKLRWRAYDAAEWACYDDFLLAEIYPGLTGAIERIRARETPDKQD